MTESNQKNRTKVWVVPVIALAIILGVIIILYFLMRGVEIRESGNKESYSIDALTCQSPSPNNVFFSSSTAASTSHSLKLTFKDEKPDKISYSYTGKFETPELAESASSSFHAKYNIDMSDHGLNPESLTPTFTPDDQTVRINLYANVNNLNATVAKFFFLTADEQRNIKTYSKETVQKIYENVGFNCKYNS